MIIYLVYGLTKDDFCDESYVKKAFKDKEKAFEYLKKEANQINVFMLPIMMFFGVIICFVCLIGSR